MAKSGRHWFLTLNEFIKSVGPMSNSARGVYVLLRVLMIDEDRPYMLETSLTKLIKKMHPNTTKDALLKTLEEIDSINPDIDIAIKKSSVFIYDSVLEKKYASYKYKQKWKKERKKKESSTRAPSDMTDPEKKRYNFMFYELQKNYHPTKAYYNWKEAKKVYFNQLRDASEGLDGDSKIDAEKAFHANAMGYITALKSSREWRDQNGRFLLGICSLIKAKPWDNVNVLEERKRLESPTERDSQITTLEDQLGI